MTAHYLRRKYGDIVLVEYVDFARPGAQERFASILGEVVGKKLWYPVVTVDDRIISYGYIDYTSIVTILEQRLQNENPTGE